MKPCAMCGRIDGGRSGDLCWPCKDKLEPLRLQLFAMGWRPEQGNPVTVLVEIRDLLRSLDDKIGNWNQPLPVQVQGSIECSGGPR